MRILKRFLGDHFLSELATNASSGGVKVPSPLVGVECSEICLKLVIAE